jgi:hypothetical protein
MKNLERNGQIKSVEPKKSVSKVKGKKRNEPSDKLKGDKRRLDKTLEIGRYI